MKKLVLSAAVLALLGLMMVAGPVLADNGPHGGYGATTDACAGCLRAHTAVGAKLLIATTTYALCVTCHGNSGSGATTNVVDGVLRGSSPAQGLKGGGFTNAIMDTNYDGASAPAAITSTHLNDGSNDTAWGNGAIGSGAGATIALSCVSCHDPHGNASTTHTATYRILRAVPTGSGAGSGVNVADQTPKVYTVADTDNLYYGENYGTRAVPLSNWCKQCHTRYAAGTGSGSTNSGDPIFKYRHMTTSALVNCMSCHTAHGTPAGMGAYSGAVAWPDSATSPNGNSRSSLLRLDNRGVCQQCHQK